MNKETGRPHFAEVCYERFMEEQEKIFKNPKGFSDFEKDRCFKEGSCRRDGYDFDARWQDGLANRREKPRESWERIFRHVKEMYPKAKDEEIQRLIGKAP